MSTINIAKGFRQFSPDELRDYGYRGLLECNGFDLSDFVERIFTDYEVETDKSDLAAIKAEEYDRGWSDAKHEAIAAVENI